MRRALTLISFLITVFTVKSQSYPQIDSIVEKSMNNFGIPGVGLAIVKNGEVFYKKNYGYANIEHEVPVSDNSVFRVYSITKVFVATAVFKLIEEGKLSLEDPISKFNLELPVNWSGLKIKHLLSHSSGLPDMTPIPEYQNLTEEEAWEKVTKMVKADEVGNQYIYNQTNFYLLQKIIESVSETSLSSFISNSQFNDDEEAFFSTDSREIIKHRVTAYFPFETGKRIITHPYLQGDYFQACNGMNISLKAFIEWDKRFRNNELLNVSTKSEMLTEFKYKDYSKTFTHGWDKRVLNNHVSYGFSGSLVTAYRIFPEDDFSIIFLGNGMSNFFNVEDVINELANALNPDIVDNEVVYTEQLLSKLEEGFNSYQEHFLSLMRVQESKGVSMEAIGNYIGYLAIRNENIGLAASIFELNVEEFPNSWNVYDSLGEAYMLQGNHEKAIQNYNKSLEVNPENSNAREMVVKMQNDKK